MPQPKKQFDEKNVLLPLYREYPAGLSTGVLSEFMNVSRITGRKKLLELQKAGKITETGTSNRHIEGESVSRNLKGRSNFNEWILTEKQHKKMHDVLFNKEYFQVYNHFIVQTLLVQPVEVPENVELLVLHGYVENKKGKWKLMHKGVEKAVEILQEREEDGG
jgi:deoxyhypusine synthase